MTVTVTPTTVTPTTTATAPTGSRRPLLRATVAASALAGAATAAVAAIARAIDVPVAIDGQQIPVLGFAQVTVFFVIVGAVLAKVLSRRAGHPHSTFVKATVALTVLSCVPSVLVDATAATKATLVLAHLVAAAIAIPTLAARLDD